MPYSNLCSIYPLLRHQQHEYYNPQAQTTAAKKMPLRESAGTGENLPNPYSEESEYLKKGTWSLEEDITLLTFVSRHGEGDWHLVKRYYGLPRSGKSCRLRWFNQLRLKLRMELLEPHEEHLIIQQHAALGNRWGRKIAAMLPGRTDSEIQNFWFTRLRRLSRAGNPEETSSLEDLEEDICATVDPSSYNLASSTAGNSPSNRGLITCNWSHSAVNVADLIAENAHGSPTATGGDCSGLEEAVGTEVNSEGACKSDSFDVALVEQLSKRRCIDTNNSINAILLKANVSCGANGSWKDRNMTTDFFATIRHDNGLPCLKLELPSVQRDESADSSSSHSSPCAASQAVPHADNTPVSDKGGSLLDVETAAISIMGAPLVATAPSAEALLQPTNDNPLSFLLGGCPLMLLKDIFSSGELQSDPSFPSFGGGPSVSVELPAGLCIAGLCEDSPWIVPQLEEEESSASAIVPNVADIGSDDVEDDDGTSIRDLDAGV